MSRGTPVLGGPAPVLDVLAVEDQPGPGLAEADGFHINLLISSFPIIKESYSYLTFDLVLMSLSMNL